MDLPGGSSSIKKVHPSLSRDKPVSRGVFLQRE